MSAHTIMELIRKMRSPKHETVLATVAELRANGGLTDGSLEGTRLHFVHLRRADLHAANLSGADLHMADLREANLRGAKLQGACLNRVNLYKADLSEANLQDTDLHKANLNRTRNVSYLQLAQAKRLRGAMMPDGRRYDGRLNLAGDIEFAQVGRIDTEDPRAMAAFYGVPVAEYLRGQEWAREFAAEVEGLYRAIELDAVPRQLRKTA